MSLVRAGTLVFVPVLAAGAVILAGSKGTLEAAAASAPHARVAGVRLAPVIAPEGEFGPNLAFQGTQDQVTLALVVEAPEGGLIHFDREASKVDAFTDDTGRILYDPEAYFGPFSMFDRVLDDGKVLVVELAGSIAPTTTARSISAKGTLVVQQAHEKVTHQSAPLKLAGGTETKVGPVALEVMGVEKSSWNEGYEIEVRTSTDLSTIVEWTWVDESGERIALERTSTMTFGGTSQIGLATPKLVSAGHFELCLWKDAKTVRTPFDAKVRIGVE